MNSDYCQGLSSLRDVIEKLVSPEGCPWDREQTPLSLADYIIEESHELVSAIRSDKPDEIRDELGDLMFLLLFVSFLYEKKDAFSFADALDQAREKMIRRHPHVFAGQNYSGAEEHLKNWERIKREERKDGEEGGGLFASLPESLPPLIKAYRIHSKAARAGFTWPTDEEAERQVESEWLEWIDASQGDDLEAQKHELGDMLFSLVEVGRRKGIKANEALDFAARRFLRRYSVMERLAREKGMELESLSLDEKDELWNEAKSGENQS